MEQYDDAYGLAELVGMETFIIILVRFGGGSIYLPSLQRIVTPSKQRMIMRDYRNGAGIKYLAQRYSLSPQWIYEIVRNARKNIKY